MKIRYMNLSNLALLQNFTMICVGKLGFFPVAARG
jgi:hypothetical protein